MGGIGIPNGIVGRGGRGGTEIGIDAMGFGITDDVGAVGATGFHDCMANGARVGDFGADGLGIGTDIIPGFAVMVSGTGF
jgi:hypothetical protein